LNRQNTSICDTSYQNAMQSLGSLMSTQVARLACLPRPPLDAAQPNCNVNDVRANADGSSTMVPLPSCSDGPSPCWRIDPASTCSSGYQLVIDRCLPGYVSYGNTPVQAACALVP